MLASVCTSFASDSASDLRVRFDDQTSNERVGWASPTTAPDSPGRLGFFVGPEFNALAEGTVIRGEVQTAFAVDVVDRGGVFGLVQR